MPRVSPLHVCALIVFPSLSFQACLSKPVLPSLSCQACLAGGGEGDPRSNMRKAAVENAVLRGIRAIRLRLG